jgi:lysozyme
MITKFRVLVATLSLSAVAFIGLVNDEGYTDKATIPTKNDRPTIGYGSTFHADGRPVKMGDTITPVRALITAQAHISKEEVIFRDSLPGVELLQGEYDIYMNWVYQYGTGAWSTSQMRIELLDKNYYAACYAMQEYRFLTSRVPTPGWEVAARDRAGKPIKWKFDCSTPGNKTCAGVWTRQQERISKCLALQD